MTLRDSRKTSRKNARSTMTRRLSVPCALAVALALALPLHRSAIGALRQLDFETLTRESRHVVTAEVLSFRSYESTFDGQAFAGRGSCMFTDVRLRVGSVLKGPLSVKDEITVQVLGGRIGDAWMRCLESETYTKGETALLFLREINGKLRATGWLQGKYTLRDDERGVTNVAGKAGLPIATSLPLATVTQQVTLLEASGSSATGSGSGGGAGAAFRESEARAAERVAADRAVEIRRVSEDGEQ